MLNGYIIALQLGYYIQKHNNILSYIYIYIYNVVTLLLKGIWLLVLCVHILVACLILTVNYNYIIYSDGSFRHSLVYIVFSYSVI